MKMTRILGIVVFMACCFAAHAADELSIAREALSDGLWEVARAHASGIITNDEAKLVVLESWAGEGKRDEIAKALGEWKDAKGPAFDYYRAVVASNHVAAAKILKDSGSVAGAAG